MYSEILSRVRTKIEVEKLKEEIDLIIDHLFSKDSVAFESFLKSNIRPWVVEILTKEWADAGDKIEYLRKLKEKLESLKYLTLILAFEPTELSIDKFFNFVRKNIGEGVVLDIAVDREILGGAKIIWQGQYRDFSLKKVFEREVEERKEELVQMLATPRE